MVKYLTKLFIKNADDVGNPVVREKYGKLSGFTGILLNVLLFAGKLAAGILSGAISIVADAMNNLSDAGSSIITLFGFKISNKPIDAEHPFGHGRVEYISGLIVSLIIMMVGFELFKSSIEKIITPENVVISVLTICILAASILVKLWLFFFNRSLAKKIHSEALSATALDSISDVLATTVVLICAVITFFTKVNIDAYAGIVVALFIFYTAIKALRGLVGLLVGSKPDPAFVKQVADFVLHHGVVCGVHDIVVHNYGPGRQMISLHAEIPASLDIMEAHDTIDNIESELAEKFKCHVVIHLDPVVTDDKVANELKVRVSDILKGIDSDLTFHDFRMNGGSTHSNLIFDVVMPFSLKMTESELVARIKKEIADIDPSYNAVISIDRPFV